MKIFGVFCNKKKLKMTILTVRKTFDSTQYLALRLIFFFYNNTTRRPRLKRSFYLTFSCNINSTNWQQLFVFTYWKFSTNFCISHKRQQCLHSFSNNCNSPWPLNSVFCAVHMNQQCFDPHCCLCSLLVTTSLWETTLIHSVAWPSPRPK